VTDAIYALKRENAVLGKMQPHFVAELAREPTEFFGEREQRGDVTPPRGYTGKVTV
jgi:hypothetical protein